MIYLLLGFFIGLVAFGIFLDRKYEGKLQRRKEKLEADGKHLTRSEENSCSGGAIAAVVIGSIFTIVLSLICLCFTLSNGNGLKKLEAFYTANAVNYETAVGRTASYLSQEKYIVEALIPVEGSVEKLELAGYISTRITEWRDAVNAYNTTIASMQYWDSNLFTGALVPNEVQDMKLLVIK